MSFPFTAPLSPTDVRTPTSAQKGFPLGTRGETMDGRVYKYSKNGSAILSKGLLVQSEAGTDRFGDATLGYLSTAWPSGTTAISSTWAYLDLSVTRDSDMTVVADFFKDGWLWVSSSSTEGGQMVQLKGHTASSSNSASSYCRFTFADGHKFSQIVDTGSFIAVQKNEYDDVIVVPTAAATAQMIGIPNSDVAANNYFWLQTWGPCPMKADTIIPDAAGVYNSTQLSGAICSVTSTTGGNTTSISPGGPHQVGRMAGMAMTDNEFVLVHLTLTP